MSKDILLQQGKGNDKVLSKEQKRFNTLVKRIEKLRQSIELVKELDIELRREGEARITPALRAAADAGRDFIFTLANSPHKTLLKPKLRERFNAMMQAEIEGVMESGFYDEDEELQALYLKYSDDGRSYQDKQKEAEEEDKEMAFEMLNHMYNMNLSQEDFDDPEKLMEKMNAKREELEAEEAAYQAKRDQRKKSPQQLAAEAARKTAESAVNKSVKQMYHDLVKHFHPDKESDEAKRTEKTEIMKQITAAYDADDHLKLLQLQMTLLSERQNVFAHFSDGQLKYFNQVLEKQARELGFEKEMSSPVNNGNRYGMLFSESRITMYANIEREIKNRKKFTKDMKDMISFVGTFRGFKEYVEDYEFEELDLGDLFDFFSEGFR